MNPLDFRRNAKIRDIMTIEPDKSDFKAPHKPYRVFSSGRILLLCLAVSVWQYSSTGSVSWITDSLRWVETSVTGGVSNNRGGGASTHGQSGSWLAPASAMAGKVIKVADGDTITIADSQGKKHKIRFFGIDSPERDQAYYRAAGKALSKLVAGKTVSIDVKDTDSYGRTVGVVNLNGQNINEEMVRSGYAWWYRCYDPNNQNLEEAEKKARAAQLGLWADKDPLPPWKWRQQHR